MPPAVLTLWGYTLFLLFSRVGCGVYLLKLLDIGVGVDLSSL